MLLVACGGEETDESASQSANEITVVATTTILGDIVRRGTCEDIRVETLLSAGQDPHSADLSARQVADIRNAALVVANGLDLEEGFSDVLLEARDSGTPVLFLGEQLDPIPFSASHAGEHDEGHASDEVHDPHVWMDPRRVIEAVRLIGAELASETTADGVACSASYLAELEALDRDVAALLDDVPDGSRRLVTNHDALGYLAERYDFEVLDTVIPGGTTLAEPSSADIVRLIETVETSGVPAIFADESAPDDLVQLVASETSTGVEVVPLFSGSLGGDGSGAESYVAMMRTNALRIAEALGPAS